MKYDIFKTCNPIKGLGMKIGEIRENGEGVGGWFGAGMGIFVILFLIIVVPYAMINGTYELLESATEVGIHKLIVAGLIMIVLELIICKFRWYGILCALVMFGALLQLPSAVKNGITWSNVDKGDVLDFFLWFIIPVIFGTISRIKNK